MITYPSTHKVFFETGQIKKVAALFMPVAQQVYMDGNNMNAQVGLTNPGFIGADVCYLNLHKTFASPHGGGGPGVGPYLWWQNIWFLPSRTWYLPAIHQNQVSAAPFGRCRYFAYHVWIYPHDGCGGIDIGNQTYPRSLNANYLAACLKDTYGVVYQGGKWFRGT